MLTQRKNRMFSQKSLVNWIWNVIILSVTIVRKLELKEYILLTKKFWNSKLYCYNKYKWLVKPTCYILAIASLFLHVFVVNRYFKYWRHSFKNPIRRKFNEVKCFAKSNGQTYSCVKGHILLFNHVIRCLCALTYKNKYSV